MIDLATGKLMHRENIATRQPPAQGTLGSGVNSGTYEIQMGLEALAEWLD